ncbi:MAG: UbiD family decarboxylase [Promethearchaeota archaeon]
MTRGFLGELERRGEVVHVASEVSPRFQIPAMVKRAGERCVVFDRVEGSALKVVSGLAATRERVAKALGLPQRELLHALAGAIEKPAPPELLAGAPCQEVVRDSPSTDFLPVCLHSGADGGPYVASGVVVARDPELGLNASFHRMMRVSGDKFTIRVVPRHLHAFLERAGGELDVAVCIGNHPAVMLAAAVSTDLGKSELDIANALHPTPVARCKTVDVDVPATTEVVLEGRITPELGPEGPFIDLTGTLDVEREQPVLEVRKVTHRREPYYQELLPGGPEHKLCMGMPREPTIYREVSRVCECTGVNITPGGCSWLHGVVRIVKKDDGDPRRAIEAAFRGHASMKHVFVVDDDVDLDDPAEVEWAMATRFQGSRGLFVYEKQVGSSLDPSADQDTRETTKVGFDLTVPTSEDRRKFTKVKIPGEDEVELG